ncbi:MAG: hypothetical protein DMF11_13500 [Verrucomicrobia bacterium]|nr:MAG: hypothetical protein DMF11_13500 [Verrucomicrobiota bacterium]
MKRLLSFVIFVVVLLVAALAVHIDWTWKRKLSPRGGRYFFHRVELAVPSFRQSEEKWRDDPLGGVPENGTLGGEGCAVAATAMVFKFYGIDVDPQQLNWFLPLVDGYTENGWIYWDRAALPGSVTHFVVIAGKQGFDYLVRDPGAGSAKGLYPLRELGSDIEALRFYEPIANASSQLSAQK